MVVLTFSGPAVADAQPIGVAVEIVRAAGGPRVVVVPPLAGVPGRFEQVIRFAQSGRRQAARALIDRIAERHCELAEKIAPSGAGELAAWIGSVRDALSAAIGASISARVVTPEVRESMFASGPLLSSRLFAAALAESGTRAAWVDAKSVTCADQTVPVIGGDEVTAARLAASLGARELQVWRHREGVLAADAGVVPSAAVVPQLSFAEAAALARSGGDVPPADAIDVAATSGIPVRVLNVRRPGDPGTIVNGRASGVTAAPAALACRRGIAVLQFSSRETLRLPVLLRRILDLSARPGVEPFVVAVPSGAILAAFDDSDHADTVAAAAHEIADVTPIRDLSLFSAVGESLSADPGIAHGVLAELDGVTVHAWAHHPSGRSITVLLDEADAAEAMRRVYDRYFVRSRAASPEAAGEEIQSR